MNFRLDSSVSVDTRCELDKRIRIAEGCIFLFFTTSWALRSLLKKVYEMLKSMLHGQ